MLNIRRSTLPKQITFAGFPAVQLNEDFSADIAVIGMPFGVSYQPGALSPSHYAPTEIRRQSMGYPEDVHSWDFDLGGTILGDSGIRVVDVGDLAGAADDPRGNLERGTAAVRAILHCGALPMVLGGDDSIPLMAFRAFEGLRDIQILQVDAHIDWRDEVSGIRTGFSSPMRRASELHWVRRIIQVGTRGTGTARRQEYNDACAYGARVFTARELHQLGVEPVLDAILDDIPCYVTIDCDGLDPSFMPGVMSPAPGGLTYYQMLDLLREVHRKAGLAGLNLVEFVPEKDINQLGAVTAMRIIWFFIGLMAHNSHSNKQD